MAPRVLEPSRDELLSRRAQLLDRARLSREELEERAEAGLLTGEEFRLWDAITSIEFLLGEDKATAQQ